MSLSLLPCFLCYICCANSQFVSMSESFCAQFISFLYICHIYVWIFRLFCYILCVCALVCQLFLLYQLYLYLGLSAISATSTMPIPRFIDFFYYVCCSYIQVCFFLLLYLLYLYLGLFTFSFTSTMPASDVCTLY